MYALRNGVILCNALNKIKPRAVPKVVSSLGNISSVSSSEEPAALSAYQYFENIRNFSVAADDIGLPKFEACDVEKGANSTKVVTCLLALKSYSEWISSGSIGTWKFNDNLKPSKFFQMKNSEPIPDSARDSPSPFNNDKLLNEIPPHESTEMFSVDMHLHKGHQQKLKDIRMVKPAIKDFMDNKKALQNRRVFAELDSVPYDIEIEDENSVNIMDSATSGKVYKEEDKFRLEKHSMVFEQQKKDIRELKGVLRSTKSDVQSMQTKYSEDICSLGKQMNKLAHAASGYYKVLDENRILYNQVQDLKGSIRVYCRVRPFLPGQSSNVSSIGHIEDGNIKINTPLKYGKEGHKYFSFNKVFGTSATQDEIFMDTQPLIRSVLDGYNVCIFAYGQTGSGKTYTMTGPKDITKQNQGVNYRALNDLFYLVNQRKGVFLYDISVQMLEIYNEQVRDLLSNEEICNSSQKAINVPGASLVPVSSTFDIIQLMDIGLRNRAIGSTAMNDRSSRSHSCLTVHVEAREIASGTILHGCMHLVDLAGSERVDKSEVAGDRLKEAQHINKSLSALGDVIAALAQKNSHVPYRNSKLTQLLQDSLGGQSKTLMFVHISPETDAIGETISTLKFAERVSTVELGTARLNKESPEVKELKEEIARLKEALAKKNGQPDHHVNIATTPAKKYSNRYLSKNTPNGKKANFRRKTTDDAANTEASSNSSPRQRKSSIGDLQELLSGSDTSPPWVDSSNETSSESVECSVVFPRQDVCERQVDSQPIQQPVVTEGFDDQQLNLPTIVSSEASFRCTGNESKLKQPQPRVTKFNDIRTSTAVKSFLQSPVPATTASRKVLNAVSTTTTTTSSNINKTPLRMRRQKEISDNKPNLKRK
ncbi:Kinesin-4 [Zostera marina]|uniref:Kinesin-4 n=1 Tax=Zostera marina TaxID=29655 RepID=A0A0K9PQI1_ZOSMR|nr:Kinesin-4 [Zostera marina]